MAKRGLLDPALEGAKRLYGVLEPEIRRLIGQGYPESVAERIASGELPMDYASRMQRAAEQGYGDIADPANRFYHGTSANIREILNSESGALGGGGVYITPSPEKASGYAQIAERVLHRGSSQNVLPLVTNINSPYHFDDYSNIPLGGINDELLRNLGYDALSVSNKGGPVEELKVPSNRVRSVNAAFDPEYTGSNILGSRVIPTTAAGLITAAALAPDQVQSAPSVGLFSAIAADSADPVEARVQQLMEPLRQDPNYTYGDLLPVKRSIDPAERESFPYGFRPAVPGIATGLLEELVRAYEMNRAGRQQEAIQSSLGALL